MVLIVEEDENPMELLAVLLDRLKREDHKKTDYDHRFSEWKLLICPHDWKNGKGGAVTRYKSENLPKSSGLGTYELAVCKLPSRDRHGKLEPDSVVYLGRAENIRERLQQYGRNGTHLCRKNGFGGKGCPLFDEIFARGCSIVYRWAPMENKADAWRTEKQLLRTYDYAWNEVSNGKLRPDDILRKLDKHASNPMKLANFSKKHLPFRQKQVGIKNGENLNFLPLVIHCSGSRPRLVSNHGGSDKNETFSCGVVLDDGSICRRPAVEGRKRCAEHKGKKTTESSTRSSMKSQPHKEDYPEIEHSSPICGVAMDDGSLCRRQPVSGRKRCDLHKGRRIYSSGSEITRYQTMPSAVFNSYSNPFHVSDSNSSLNSNNCSTPICGAPTSNGTPCKRTVNGNGRCWQHGQHLIYSGSRSSSNDFIPRISNNDSTGTSICGAPTRNGSYCRRTVQGNGTCWQH